jgi:hypothetical protein
VTVECSRKCQIADWKPHKKVCGKKPKEDILCGMDKPTYEADMDVAAGYLETMSASLFFCRSCSTSFGTTSPSS